MDDDRRYPGSMRLLLVLGASMRLTRLVITDHIGKWYVKDPVDAAMERYEQRHEGEEEPWWWRLRSGLDCPYCVGFWIGAGVLASSVLAGGTRPWRFVAGALTLNEVAAHLGSALGDFDEGE